MHFPIETSIATVCLSGSLPEKLEAIAHAGFDAVEIFENDLIQFDGTPREVRDLTRKHGLRVSMYQPFRDLEGLLNPVIRKRTFERLERKLQLMQELGTDLILLCSNVGECSADMEVIVRDLREAAELAAKYNMKIAYEALSWGTHVNRWETSWKIAEKVDHPNLGICLDTFHIYCLGDNVDNLHTVPGHKIFIVQFADAPLLRMEPLQYSRHHRNFPYQGQFPLTKFVHALTTTGYDGPYSLEIFNDEFRSAPSSRIALDGYRSLLLLQEQVHKSLIPPTPRTAGVEFIEFACSPSEMNALERFIGDRLGFSKIGQHRSKSVYLYRQGQTHFILNSEPESYASAFHLDHGVSVCAIAISVDDVTLAIERAVTLKYQVISQEKRGLGELQLVAIQAPDESLIYLLDAANPTSFLSDFILDTDVAENNPQVNVKVDYISQVLDPGEMDKTVLFYHALFGLEAQQQLFELNDPRGLVRSRAMTSKCGTLRMYLNVSAAESTVVGRFLSHSGSGIHHVALGTDNIFSTLEKIGNSFLSLPQNYFDDLSVRYDLSQGELRKLYEANVMYDADADGEFLHACTDTFEDRFFFEIVERRKGYAGFGGLDAMVRTSVQQERRGLSQELKSLKDLTPKVPDSTGITPKEPLPTIVLVHEDDEAMDLFCTVMGRPKASPKAFTSESVISMSRSEAPQVISNLRQSNSLLVVNAKNVLEKENNASWVSAFCDYEFVYDPSQSYRKGLARFVRMILRESDFHDRVTSKSRTTFLALTFPNVQSALQNLDILSVGADAVELRVDLLKEPSGLDKPTNGIPFSVDYVGSQVSLLRNRTELPIVFTVRSLTEGGLFPSEAENEAHDLLRKAIQWGCEYVDVEARLSQSIRQDLGKRRGVSKIISSYHDLSGRMRWSSVDVTRVYHAAREYGDIVKIIGFANTLAENYELEYFRASMTSSYGTPLLAINAGTMGQLSRVLNRFFTPTTHPLLPMAAAPGQLSAAEINGALHIVGQLPSRTYHSIGKQDASPLTGFFQKFFNELGLHHRHSVLDHVSDETLKSLTRQFDFGGAMIHPPLKTTSFIKSNTASAETIGLVDTLYLRSEGSTSVVVGDNTAWRGIHDTLTSDFAPLAYRNKPALVLANSADDAAAAIYSLLQLECQPIYTIGFSSHYPNPQIQHLRNPSALKSIEKNLFVVVSALPAEQSHLCHPLLQMITLSQPVTPQSGRVFVDLANGPRRGDPLGAAKQLGWVGFGVADVVAWGVKETISSLIGENVPFDFVRTACGGGTR